MTITKGFLNKNVELKPVHLISSLLIWVLWSYILYGFFQLCREAFRMLMGQLGDAVMLILTQHEHYFYNVFLAGIASALGYSFALRYLLTITQFMHDRNTRLSIRRTLTTEDFFSWSFLFWFGEVGSVLGIFYTTYALQYDIDFAKDYLALLILIPVVLFYSSWPNYSRLVRTKKLIWFFGTTGIFLAMSAGFAFKNFTEYDQVDKNYLNNSIEHTFDLRVPVSQSQTTFYKKSLALNIFIVRDTIETNEPAIFIESITNRIDVSTIQQEIRNERIKFSEWEYDRLVANLHIDKRIPLRQINPILDELRKSDIRSVQFSTGAKNSRYPADYPPFKYSGIQKALLPPYYPEFKTFLDSVEKIDLKGKTFRLPKSPMYRNGRQKNYNRIEITLTQDSVTLNGEKIDPERLEKIVFGFIKKYAPNYLIIFNSDDGVTYDRYIEYLDLLWTPVDRLRNEFSLEHYRKPFNYWFIEPEKDTIREKYPRNILEWSTEEKRLNQLIQKAGNKPEYPGNDRSTSGRLR